MFLQSSFASVKSWLSELRKNGSTNTIVALAGNKCDLEDLREVQHRGKKVWSEGCIGGVTQE